MNTTHRWMQPEDIEQVVKVCSDLSVEFIDKFLCRPSSVCNVVLIENKVVGFAFYQLKKFKIIISYIAVDSKFKRKRIGSELIKNIFYKLNNKRKKIEAEISEYDLEAQLFFKKMGFKVNKILKYNAGDSYLFRYVSEQAGDT